MIRIIQAINFLGVLALAGLCVLQWQANTHATHEAQRLDQIRLDQEAKIADQAKTLKINSSDLDDLHQRLTLAESQQKDTETKLAAIATDRDKISADRDKIATERDQLKSSLTQWMSAVSARDDTIKQASAQIEKLNADRNDAVAKFNDLVSKYNALIKDANDKAKS